MANEKKLDCVILGLLSDEDLTGYEIKKRMDTTLKLFWGASFGSIYPTLKQLEGNDLATKVASKENGRMKNTYSITEKGRIYLAEWLALPAEKDEMRYETLLKLFFGGNVGAKASLAHVKAFEEKIMLEMPFITSSIDILEKISNQDTAHIYYLLTAKFGEKVFHAYLEWCEEAKRVLGEVPELQHSSDEPCALG
jgi:DNA-binding PadR family transcriptional regulator